MKKIVIEFNSIISKSIVVEVPDHLDTSEIADTLYSDIKPTNILKDYIDSEVDSIVGEETWYVSNQNNLDTTESVDVPSFTSSLTEYMNS